LKKAGGGHSEEVGAAAARKEPKVGVVGFQGDVLGDGDGLPPGFRLTQNFLQ
jgi:hypothetical protein